MCEFQRHDWTSLPVDLGAMQEGQPETPVKSLTSIHPYQKLDTEQLILAINISNPTSQLFGYFKDKILGVHFYAHTKTKMEFDIEFCSL